MVDDRKPFDAATSVLHPVINLVEASAGTGKTYAIAMLVLRFITELSYPLETILIVTFTKAATQELASRVRMRLVEARDLLLGQLDNVDPTLSRWADKLEKPDLALERIRVALNDIDSAAIFTIHGFCQRMLQEQALESGQLFDVELKADIEKLRNQIAEDFWRRNLYRLTPLQCGVILSVFDSPAKLFKSVGSIPGHGSIIEPSLGEMDTARDRVEQCYNVMVSWWQHNSATLQTSLQQLVDEKKVKSDFLKGFSSWWQDLDSYFCRRQNSPPKDLQHLSSEGFATVINGSRVRGKKKDELLVTLNLPDVEMTPFLQAIEEIVLILRVSFAKSLSCELEKRMLQDNTMSYKT